MSSIQIRNIKTSDCADCCLQENVECQVDSICSDKNNKPCNNNKGEEHVTSITHEHGSASIVRTLRRATTQWDLFAILTDTQSLSHNSQCYNLRQVALPVMRGALRQSYHNRSTTRIRQWQLFTVQEPKRAAGAGPGTRSEAGEESLQEHRVDRVRSRAQKVPEPRSVAS